MYHALKEIVAKEGFGDLYKGLFPSLQLWPRLRK
uniref:Uncharacterized protein n=1 Tax=Oryza punctata TaxID=4537 RepID=A0A0E0KZ66_ORYPU